MILWYGCKRFNLPSFQSGLSRAVGVGCSVCVGVRLDTWELSHFPSETLIDRPDFLAPKQHSTFKCTHVPGRFTTVVFFLLFPENELLFYEMPMLFQWMKKKAFTSGNVRTSDLMLCAVRLEYLRTRHIRPSKNMTLSVVFGQLEEAGVPRRNQRSRVKQTSKHGSATGFGCRTLLLWGDQPVLIRKMKVWYGNDNSHFVLGITGNALGSSRKSWRNCPGRGKSGCPCSDSCPHDLAKDKWKKMDGWMDGWSHWQ